MTDLHIKSIGYLLKEGISHVIKKIFLKKINFVYNYENLYNLKNTTRLLFRPMVILCIHLHYLFSSSGDR